MSDEEETITVPKSQYEELVDDSNFLTCLRGAGVDNWDGYDFAIEEFQSMKGEEE